MKEPRPGIIVVSHPRRGHFAGNKTHRTVPEWIPSNASASKGWGDIRLDLRLAHLNVFEDSASSTGDAYYTACGGDP